MIEVPIWVAIVMVIGVLFWYVKVLRQGRVEGFQLALITIVSVSEEYGKGEDRLLDAHEMDVAHALNLALPDLIEGYTRQQVDEALRARP